MPPGNADELRAAARRFADLANENARMHSAFTKATSEALDAWHGSQGREQFAVACGQAGRRFRPVNQLCWTCSTELHRHAEALEAAKKKIKHINSRLAATASANEPAPASELAGTSDESVLRAQGEAVLAALHEHSVSCASMCHQARKALVSSCPGLATVRQMLGAVRKPTAAAGCGRAMDQPRGAGAHPRFGNVRNVVRPVWQSGQVHAYSQEPQHLRRAGTPDPRRYIQEYAGSPFDFFIPGAEQGRGHELNTRILDVLPAELDMPGNARRGTRLTQATAARPAMGDDPMHHDPMHSDWARFSVDIQEASGTPGTRDT